MKDISLSNIIFMCLQGAMLIIGFFITSLIADLKKTIQGLMSKEMCKLYHDSHDKEHIRIEKDLNGFGERLNHVESGMMK